MFRKIRRLSVYACLLAGFIISLNGCATLFKGTSDNVHMSSSPAGAKVFVNGELMGTTPVKLKLKSSETYHIEFKKKGYATKVYNLTNHVGAGWIVLDVLGGLVPIIVDAATNSWYKLDQTHFNAVMESQQP
ncbi:MAG TPA: PEGA domain-containing protein [Balneolales bacterium]|nr:PEGA domain-containing protein [Balneolales bacterium]